MSNPRNINQLIQGAVASQPARLPAIPTVQVNDRALADLLKAIKERLEVREGERGNPFEATVTRRELDDLGIVRTAPAPCRVTELSGIVGQTKAGEFVSITINDLADAVANVSADGGMPSTSTATGGAELTALRAEFRKELSDLRSLVDRLGTGSGTPSVADGAFTSWGGDKYKGQPYISPNVVFFNGAEITGNSVDTFTVRDFAMALYYRLYTAQAPILANLDERTMMYQGQTVAMVMQRMYSLEARITRAGW